MDSSGVDDVIAFLGFAIEVGDFFGTVLEVAVHDYDPVALGVVEAGGDGIVLAEVAGEIDAFYLGVDSALFHDLVPGVVGRSIVDEDDFIVFGDGTDAFHIAPYQLGNHLLSTIDRGNY
jgi:hypothetical protein